MEADSNRAVIVGMDRDEPVVRIGAAVNLTDCVDCGRDTVELGEFYSVRKDVWRRTGGGRGMLCIGCAEARLGRRLGPADFTDYAVNYGWQSARLHDRLTAGAFPGRPPVCGCHGEPMFWDAQRWLLPAGGNWICAVERREEWRRYLADGGSPY